MALEDDIAFFTSHPLLGAMQHEALRLVAFSADRRSFRAGDILARRGEKAETAFLIISGTLALDEHDDGRPSVTLLGEGALCGELALFAATERPATVIAREPVVVLVIRREVMARVLAEFPASAHAVHGVITQRLQGLNAALAPVRAALDRIKG
jgi:CRP-like cAMP-binding protein